VGAPELPTGEAARQLELAHLYVTLPLRLDSVRRGEPGMPPARAAIAGVSADQKGWLLAWVAYIASTTDAPTFSVWPTSLVGARFDVVLPATAELELIARVDTPERAVARLTHHLRPMAQARIDPDMEYLRRAIGSYRGELRRERDRARAWEETIDQETDRPPP
jgi:hypothetical protein